MNWGKLIDNKLKELKERDGNDPKKRFEFFLNSYIEIGIRYDNSKLFIFLLFFGISIRFKRKYKRLKKYFSRFLKNDNREKSFSKVGYILLDDETTLESDKN